MMNKKKILLLFGGESSEHEVSVSSAKNVFDAINKDKYEVELCFIDKTGQWWSVDDINETTQSRPVLVKLGAGELLVGDRLIKTDVILPILHGENGEDGTVQGLAKLMHIPIVGCGMLASAICMDKVVTKELLEFNGIKTAPFCVYNLNDTHLNYDDISHKLGGDVLFVKPANAGSSVGVSKVTNSAEFSDAVCLAQKYDSKVLIEKALVGRELEVGILDSGKDIRASSVGEIIPDREFYSYESKYDPNSKTTTVTLADIPNEVSKQIQTIAMKAFQVTGCNGMARIDFFLVNDSDIYLNEINTIPGFTNISMYPKLFAESGISYGDLIDTLICQALE